VNSKKAQTTVEYILLVAVVAVASFTFVNIVKNITKEAAQGLGDKSGACTSSVNKEC